MNCLPTPPRCRRINRTCALPLKVNSLKYAALNVRVNVQSKVIGEVVKANRRPLGVCLWLVSAEMELDVSGHT